MDLIKPLKAQDRSFYCELTYQINISTASFNDLLYTKTLHHTSQGQASHKMLGEIPQLAAIGQ